MCLQLLEPADVNLEEEPRWRKEERREANRAGRGRKGPLSSSFQESWSTETSPTHTHHGPPANHSSSILDPSSFIQLLIHGSLKQMWGDAGDGREPSDNLYQNISHLLQRPADQKKNDVFIFCSYNFRPLNSWFEFPPTYILDVPCGEFLWGLATMANYARWLKTCQEDSDWGEAMRARREARMVPACSPCTNIRSASLSS